MSHARMHRRPDAYGNERRHWLVSSKNLCHWRMMKGVILPGRTVDKHADADCRKHELKDAWKQNRYGACVCLVLQAACVLLKPLGRDCCA